MGKERWERFIGMLKRRMEFGPRRKNETLEDIDRVPEDLRDLSEHP